MKYNYDDAKRHEIIRNNSREFSNVWLGGTKGFVGLTKKGLQELVDLKFANPSDKHNFAPSIKKFLEIAEKDPSATFDGYIVSPDREDYRVSIDSVTVSNEIAKKLRNVSERRHIDENITNLWWD